MRALAEYVMRGRMQAVIVAAVATGSVLFAWIGAAVVALVTLRKGTNQGLYVLFWALLPAFIVAWGGDTGPLTTLLGVALAASAGLLELENLMRLCCLFLIIKVHFIITML